MIAGHPELKLTGYYTHYNDSAKPKSEYKIIAIARRVAQEDELVIYHCGLDASVIRRFWAGAISLNAIEVAEFDNYWINVSYYPNWQEARYHYLQEPIEDEEKPLCFNTNPSFTGMVDGKSLVFARTIPNFTATINGKPRFTWSPF